MGRLGCCIAAFATLITPAAAQADAVTLPLNLAASLRYPVTGQISPACTLTQDQRAVDVVGPADPMTDTVRATRTDLGFAVNCNSRMKVRMLSQEGDFRFSGTGTSDSAFVSLVPYDAQLELPGVGSALGCRSDLMANDGKCAATPSGVVTSGRGRIEIRTAASNGLLLAGQYTDRVTFSLTPLLGG